MRTILALYSAAHFWVDLSCALIVLRRLGDTADLATLLLLYNFCAFALQMPLGLLADRLDRNAHLAALGCLLTAAAAVLPGTVPVVLGAGLGNALFHLGGGLDTLNRSGERAAPLGVFVSPGALGLFLGTLWSGDGAVPLLSAPLGLVLLAAAILVCVRHAAAPNAVFDVSPKGSLLPLLPLFAVVVLRSAMGMGQTFPWKGEHGLLLVLALVLGKAAGGALSDRFGPRRTAVASLALAALLYLCSGHLLAGLAAVLLFNMTMPITLHAAAKRLPGAKGFSFGLLTFALFLGFLPAYLGGGIFSAAACALCALISLLLLLWGLGKEEVL